MIRFGLTNVRTVLCLGAHADDIEIGCGGTLLKLWADHAIQRVCWVVFGAGGARADEARRSSERWLEGVTEPCLHIHAFRDGFFPFEGAKIKERFQELGAHISPDVIFTHRREDMHQDHRLVAELTWQTFRDHLILEYEIPKYEGDLGSPNVLVPLDESTCREKIKHLLQAFSSQRSKPWFREDAFWSLLRLRGIECHSPTGYAEGVYCRKLTI